MFREQKAELERSNQWADSLNRGLEEARARIGDLQRELEREQESARLVAEGYETKLHELEADLASKITWARDAEKRLDEQIADKQTAIDALHHTEKELADRTAWALSLEEERRRVEEQLVLYRTSRWVRLGRKVGLGPELPTS
jgi:chromosome segregation ATPase